MNMEFNEVFEILTKKNMHSISKTKTTKKKQRQHQHQHQQQNKPSMNLKNLSPTLQIRQPKFDLSIQSTRTNQGRIKGVRPVSSHQNLDVSTSIETIWKMKRKRKRRKSKKKKKKEEKKGVRKGEGRGEEKRRYKPSWLINSNIVLWTSLSPPAPSSKRAPPIASTSSKKIMQA